MFDFRTDCQHQGFNLPDVGARKSGDSAFGGLFLDHLTQPDPQAAPAIPFNVAYPNLYLVTNEETILLTHGHYLESYWAAAGELVPKIAGNDAGLEGDKPNLWELVALNMPLNQLACTGVGQAGPLTKLVRKVQRDVKDRHFDRIDLYLDRLDDEILDKYFNFGRANPKEWATDAVINTALKHIKNELRGIEDTRFAMRFVEKAEVRERFIAYVKASVKELGRLNRSHEYNQPAALPQIDDVIFAHTHVPIPWTNEDLSIEIERGHEITLHNTGGWLYRMDDDGTEKFVGAEVFFCDEGVMSSESID